jgi:hypothetical protein
MAKEYMQNVKISAEERTRDEDKCRKGDQKRPP